MMGTMRAVVVVALLALGIAADGGERSSRPVRGHGYTGVIFSAASGKSAYLNPDVLDWSPVAGVWTPEPQHVAALEALLPARLREWQGQPDAIPTLARKSHHRCPDCFVPQITRIIADLPKYRRQYVGIVLEDGAKLVYVNAFIPHALPPGVAAAVGLPDWKHELHLRLDGGCSALRLLYDIERHEFAALACNGEA